MSSLMRIHAYAQSEERVLAVEAEDGAVAIAALTSANGTWDSGHEVAAGTITRLRERLRAPALPDMDAATALLVAAHREASAAQPDRDAHDGRIDVMLARIQPGSVGIVELAWAGGCRAFLMRGGVLHAHARPHCQGESLVTDARRREQIYAEPEYLPLMRTRLLDADEPPNLEQLCIWPFGPAETLVMLNDTVWERLDDATIIGLALGDDPARALVEATGVPRRTVAAIVVQRV